MPHVLQRVMSRESEASKNLICDSFAGPVLSAAARGGGCGCVVPGAGDGSVGGVVGLGGTWLMRKRGVTVVVTRAVTCCDFDLYFGCDK